MAMLVSELPDTALHLRYRPMGLHTPKRKNIGLSSTPTLKTKYTIRLASNCQNLKITKL